MNKEKQKNLKIFYTNANFLRKVILEQKLIANKYRIIYICQQKDRFLPQKNYELA